MSSNSRKSVFLGMPHGTAVSRLRKLVLFDLLKRHNENVCVRCGKEILTADDLSVEHIQPWEGKSVELFWDLQNIAFSHKECNTPHTFRGGVQLRKIGPPGTAWCWQHKQFLPVENFYEDRSNWNGLLSRCKECHNSRPR